MLIVGEEINASIKFVGEALRNKDDAFLTNLTKDQTEAGTDFIDVNAGVGEGDWESAAAAMEWLVQHVQRATDKPLCVDSDDPAVLKAAFSQYDGQAVMINSMINLKNIRPLSLAHPMAALKSRERASTRKPWQSVAL